MIKAVRYRENGSPVSLSILQFIPYTEAELEKVIEKRIRKNTPIRKTAGKTAKKKTGEIRQHGSDR